MAEAVASCKDGASFEDFTDIISRDALFQVQVRSERPCPLLALPLPFCHRLVPLLALPLPFCHRLMPLLAVLQSGRFYCALSLAEAETLRGVIHARHDDPLV